MTTYGKNISITSYQFKVPVLVTAEIIANDWGPS